MILLVASNIVAIVCHFLAAELAVYAQTATVRPFGEAFAKHIESESGDAGAMFAHHSHRHI